MSMAFYACQVVHNRPNLTVRAFGIWLFGSLGSGIAGGIIGVALLVDEFPIRWQGLASSLGLRAGLSFFASLRLWSRKIQTEALPGDQGA